MRSQVELLLRERVHCDRHGRYLQPPPRGLDVLEWEDRLASAMAAQLQRHSNCSSGSLLRLASRGMVDAEAEGGGGGGGGAGSELGRPGSLGGSGSAALLADNPSPFDNQVGTAELAGPVSHMAMPFPHALSGGQCLPLPFNHPNTNAHPSTLPTHPQEVEPHLNLAPFLNRAPATVRLETPATRVHSMMLSLSLRWVLCIVCCWVWRS